MSSAVLITATGFIVYFGTCLRQWKRLRREDERIERGSSSAPEGTVVKAA